MTREFGWNLHDVLSKNLSKIVVHNITENGLRIAKRRQEGEDVDGGAKGELSAGVGKQQL